MYKINYSTEKKPLTNGDSNNATNQLAKSLTSFHTKKNASKNISSQNPPKKQVINKEEKSVKSKRVYLSSKKVKALNYLKLNQISPDNNIIYDLNKQGNETNQKNKIYNAPSSVRRSFKYKNCYILNNLNNYQPNVIPGAIIKTTNNKYTEIKLSESIDNNIDNNNNSYTKSENRKTNGASSNTNDNINDTNENNSLIPPSGKGLNTITFNINNNFNNCYNNFSPNNNNNAKSYSNFNGYMNAMGNKSVTNSNDFATFNSREKLSNKLEDSVNENINNINIDIGNDNKIINNKRSNLFKDKANNKIKTKQNIYSNTNSVSNLNNSKKNQKPIILSNKDEIISNKKYIYETVDNIMQNEDNNFIRTKNIYKFNNKKINSNNPRNFERKSNEVDNTKSKNSSIGDLKNQKEISKDKNNIINNKHKDSNSEINSQYQTYSGSFRNNNKMIRVNMIEAKKSNNIISDNNLQNANQQKIGFKNNNKSSNNIKISLDKSDNKNIYGCKKYNKKNNSESNKKINIINNNKAKYNNKNKNNKNILIQTYNEFKKGKNEENINEKGDINQTTYNESNYKNDFQTKSVNCLDCYTKKSNIIPLTRENSITYVRKKSLNMKMYNNENENNNLISNRAPAFKHKKNYSISTSGYNSQRYLNEVKIDLKNNKNNKKNFVYSPKNDVNKINEKTVVIPEYQIKLENIKSRINNLLNVYSLLALRSLNISNEDNNNNNDNFNKNKLN